MASRKRTFTVVIGFAATCLIVRFVPAIVFNLAAWGVASWALDEWWKLHHLKQHRALFRGMVSVWLLSSSIIFLAQNQHLIILILLILPLILLILVMFVQIPSQMSIDVVAKGILGYVYITPFLFFIIMLRGLAQGSEWVLITIICTWGRDTGAYFTGRLLSNQQAIIANVNPKKSYQGMVGGTATAILLALIAGNLLALHAPTALLAVAGAVIGIFGQIGDLVESWFKRNLSVQDSGKSLPGQGGILDTIDGFIFTAPAMYYLLSIA